MMIVHTLLEEQNEGYIREYVYDIHPFLFENKQKNTKDDIIVQRITNSDIALSE